MIEPGTIERAESGGAGWLINHLPAIIWQRRMYVIVPFVLLSLIGLVTAFTLPTIYRSSATLLVESQDLPTDIVQAPGIGRDRRANRPNTRAGPQPRRPHQPDRAERPVSVGAQVEADVLGRDQMRTSTTVGAFAGDIGRPGPTRRTPSRSRWASTIRSLPRPRRSCRPTSRNFCAWIATRSRIRRT